jgi:endonuclease YncB( thermonuclease family)
MLTRRWLGCWVLALLLVAVNSPVHAHVIDGRVVGVADGDTLDVLTADKQKHRIRLAGIDAPESRQAFGKVAKKHLSDLVFAQDVRVLWSKHDRYGRVIGKVLRGNTDVCLAMVRDGYAWHFKRYQSEQEAAERSRYAAAETEARRAHRGLWVDRDPVAPWDFRKTPAAHTKTDSSE